MSGGQGEKREKPREEKVKGGGGPLSYFFSAQDFLAAFLIFPQFSRPNQPGRSVHKL